MTIRLSALPLLAFGAAFGALLCATHCASKGEQDAVWISSPACQTEKNCVFPAPVCNDAGTALLYYSDPKCVAGSCQWTTQTMSCPCVAGSCDTGGSILVDPGGGADGSTLDASDEAARHPVVPAPDAGSCAEEDASACALPPSVCVDDHWLAYFRDAVCVEGRCLWTVQYLQCGSACSGQGCIYNGTH